MRILKYELNISGDTSFDMYEDSKILSCQNQRNRIMMWALVDESKAKATRYFSVFMTGIKYTDPSLPVEHISSVVLDDGNYVAHVFERITSKIPKH